MTLALAFRIVLIAATFYAAYRAINQCRRPTGALGRNVAKGMNISHAALTTWGLEHVRVEPSWRILDVGCGGGQTLKTLAALASAGHVSGVDYAPASLETSRQVNAELIASGRMDVQPASVSTLPFDDATFDLVTAVETHYYWPDLANDFREVRRVLKPGGRFVLIAETYKGRRFDVFFRPAMTLLLRSTYLSLDEHRAALTTAGFTHVEIDAIPAKGWMCVMGTA